MNLLAQPCFLLPFFKRSARIPWMLLLSGVLAGIHLQASAFSSGSNGSDGALDLTTPGIIEINPTVMGLDTDGDNVFHFTTINIGTGTTVKLTGRYFNGPVYWLASGNVIIDGIIDLNGQDGQVIESYQNAASRIPAIPGAGGYPGGVGRFGNSNPQPGGGPGGGPAGSNINLNQTGGGGGHATVGDSYRSGTTVGGPSYGNPFLVPLVGGSGGGGGWYNTLVNGFPAGGGGGGGGGALLLASSQTVTIDGTVMTRGGSGKFSSNGNINGAGGGGSGGAIHILADTVKGGGKILSEDQRNGYGTGSAPGRIRIDALNNQFTGTLNPTPALGTPYSTYLPTNPPTLRAVSVDGQALPSQPTGSFAFPDTTINNPSPVTVDIAAKFIPLGTIVKLYVYSENGDDQTIDSTPLTGSLDVSTATATVTLPSGFSRGFLRAVWPP